MFKENIMNKKRFEKFLWKWKLFWGNCYLIYDTNRNPIKKVLIYHKKIFFLDIKGVK